MSSVTSGLIASVLCTLVLCILFSYEEKRGSRFLSRARVYADILVLRFSRGLHRMFQFVGRDLIRQLARYVYHQVLRTTLSLIRRCEGVLRNAIQTNRTIAQGVDDEREVRSKLEEIALHKAAVALSEDEKRQHRDKMLEG